MLFAGIFDVAADATLGALLLAALQDTASAEEVGGQQNGGEWATQLQGRSAGIGALFQAVRVTGASAVSSVRLLLLGPPRG